MPGTRPAEQLRAREWEPRCPVAGCGQELEPVPVIEERELRPASVYGISKRDTEELALVGTKPADTIAFHSGLFFG